MDARRFAIVAEQFFDGERLHLAPHTVRVVDGLVEGVDWGDFGQVLTDEGWPVERGGFLLPPVVDAHVHLFLDGASTDLRHRAEHLRRPLPQLTEAARANAREAAQWGVTLVRDAGDRHGINHRLRDEARVPGSRLAQVRSVGPGLKRPGRYGAFMGRDAGGTETLGALVGELAARSDEIKLILTGIIDFEAARVRDEPQFDAVETRLVVQAAHRCGRKVMAHCSGAQGLAIAIQAGADSIEHGFFLDRALLARMRDADIAWTPTFSPVHFQWSHPRAAHWPAATVDGMRRILDEHAENLRIAHQLGVRLMIGTDAGSMGVQHGRSVFEEMQRFLDAGLPLESVLRAATAVPRRHFGAAAVGFAAGAPLQAVLFQQPPFTHARALHRPRRVWNGEHSLAGAQPLATQ